MENYSQEEYQTPLTLVTPMNWVVFVLFLGLFIAIAVYLFFASIPIKVKGDGLIFNPNEVFAVESPSSGTIYRVITYWGEELQEGTPLIELGPPKTLITSKQKGSAFALEVAEGDHVEKGTPLLWIQNPLPPKEGLQVSGVIPYRFSNQIHVGMEAEAHVTGANITEYGKVKGRVSAVIPFSKKEGVKRFPIAHLIPPSMEKDLFMLIVIDLVKDAYAGDAYTWTSGKGPPFSLQVGMPCKITITVEDKKLISYLFNKKKS